LEARAGSLKEDGLVISYKILRTEAHGSTGWNLMLMTEYKDLTTYQKNLEKSELCCKRSSATTKSRDKVPQRLEIRKVLADR
jgi:hypothetical protein